MTVTIENQFELEALIKDGNIIIDDDLVIKCDVCVDANIDAKDIKASNINALNINALNINALNIDVLNIDALNIKARNIKARNIDGGNIDAKDIKAGDINYYAVCFAYNNIKCKSIKGRRDNAKHFCLDGEITIKPEEKKKITLELTDKQLEQVQKLLILN